MSSRRPSLSSRTSSAATPTGLPLIHASFNALMGQCLLSDALLGRARKEVTGFGWQPQQLRSCFRPEHWGSDALFIEGCWCCKKIARTAEARTPDVACCSLFLQAFKSSLPADQNKAQDAGTLFICSGQSWTSAATSTALEDSQAYAACFNGLAVSSDRP